MGIQNILKTVQLEPREAGRGRSGYKKPKAGEEIVITENQRRQQLNDLLLTNNLTANVEFATEGMSGKFPDSDDVYQFRDNLYNKVDLVSGDFRRWKPIHPEVPQRTGKLNDIDKFDMGFFGISKLQSDNMDPMIRMALEKVYEAMVDAGYHPFDLEKTNTGVFVGTCFSETEKNTFYNNQVGNADAISGTQRSMIAKRINYFYKLNGPSFITDSACSSSMFALEHAYVHLKEDLCDKAIVCGTHLCLHPIVSLQFARLGVLSPDGCCKSFDNSGNGYARSEAMTVLILEKSKDAKRIYAEIIHSKTNCDGYKEQGITFPSSGMQKVLLKEFYDEVQINPTTLTFVEAHGTGTQVGDPEELNTLDDIFCSGRDRPLHIGTIKSNIGHNEPVSGLCSIVKVLIGMENGFIPPNINYSEPRKGVDALERGRLLVVTEKMPWPDNKVFVGVNSFGFGGANGHVLLKWNPKVKVNNGEPKDNLPRLICISGRTRIAMETIINDVTSRKLDAEFIKLIHQVYRKLIPNQLFRGYTIITKEEEITRKIIKLTSIQTKLCLVFTNFDEKWFQLGKDLLAIPVFAGAIQRIHDVLHQKLSLNVSSVLINSNKENYVNQVLGTVSVQLAIAHVLKELNLNVHMMIGIGFGELLCGYLDDCFSMEEVILSAYHIANELEKNIIETDKKILNVILRKKVHKPNRWVPIYNRDQHNVVYPLGSINYLINNILRPISQEDCQQYMKSDEVALIIGNSKKNKDNDVVLLDLNHNDTTINFLDSLGKIYLKGVDMELDKLYPQIAFPVSRGTPMLSPLVKWDHKQICTVFLYRNEEEKKSGQRVIHVGAKSEDWGFVIGHVVDGRNLFPATGYLTLVWESYAMMIGKLMSQMSIVFENVKFLTAANVPAEGVLTLRVMIQLGNKYFEVIENESILVSGNVYELRRCHKFADLPCPVEDVNEITLQEKDVYKELRLRGYHYINQFRAIKRCSMDGTKAIISWNGNWITFMDNMLQIQILQEDTRNLYVPTSIQKLIIDGPRQIKYSHKYQNEIPVVCHKTLGLISGGGVEIRGLGASFIPRRRTGEPVLETYKFIPYKTQLSEKDALRCLVQVILENSNVIKVKAVEMDAEKLFMPLVQQTLADLPLIQSELIVLSKKQLDIPGVHVDDKQLSMESGCLLVLATNILSNNDLLDIALKATRDSSGYIISYQCFNPTVLPPSNIKIISTYDIETGTLVLLQEAKDFADKKPITINVSFENLSWIRPLTSIVKSNQKVVLYCQNSEPEGILGLVNCLRREPNGSNIYSVILMDKAPPFVINHEFYKKQLEKNVAINIWKNGQWGSYRHLLMPQIQMINSEHCFVNVTTRGDLSSLKWIEGCLSKNTIVEPESELVDIYYSAINFRDVMTASGKIQAAVITRDRVLQECVQGFEFSGRDSSGRRVMGMVTSGALSTMIIADKHLLWHIPIQWSLEDAATIPVVYGTVIYALLVRGDMKKGQSILIHSGTGGVGQAAINIAIHNHCVIFTTVGTPEKKEFIKRHFPQINEEHIGDSRSTSFEQMVLKYTNGKGVDFVLNSLSEEKLQASVRCLASKGTFLEIGKFDLASDNHIAVDLLKKQANFQGIMLDQLFVGSSEIKGVLTRELTEGMRSGAVKPLVRTTFNDGEIEKAFRYMATGKHMGKVLIKIRDEERNTAIHKVSRTLFKGFPRFYCNPDSTYVVLGGLGGFGLELTDWLVIRGAKKLVLASRSGVKNGYQAFRLNIFKSYGTRVIIRNDDVTSKKGCENLLMAAGALGSVDGIFNLAVVLQDGLFENQSEEAFRKSLVPKAIASNNLDTISRLVCPNLRYFVVFSSVSCGRGNAGQTNYGMANSVMERICEMRKKDGYPALAIQWGAIGEVGLVAEMQENYKDLTIGGTLQQRISSCLETLDYFLRQDETVVASMVVAEKKTGLGAGNIFDAVLNIIGVTNLKAVSIHATFPELGMDSMMAVEIKQTLEREYEVFLTAQDIRNMTIAKLKDMVNETVETTPTNQLDEQMNTIPEDIQLLFRYIADEQSANIPMIHLNTAIERKSKASVVFGLAGIEGMAAIFEPIAKHMKFHFSCLQFCTGNDVDTIEELSKPLAKVIESTPGEFYIIAYSYGCVVAVELMLLLESSGKTGKALFIDGAPDLLTKLAKMYFPEVNEQTFQTSILCILMTRYMSYDEILKHKFDIMKHKTYEDKIRYVIKISPKVDHTEHYIIDMANAALNRIKSLRKYQPKDKRLNSVITLVKPTKQSVVEIEEDYNLSSICKREVRMHILEGNHVTILENQALRDVIEQFMETDDNVRKIPMVGQPTERTIGIKNI